MSNNDNVFISDWYIDNWTLGEDLVQKKREINLEIKEVL